MTEIRRTYIICNLGLRWFEFGAIWMRLAGRNWMVGSTVVSSRRFGRTRRCRMEHGLASVLWPRRSELGGGNFYSARKNDMFVAGTDTTSATLDWVMTELARHPQVMKKAQKEVRGIVGSRGVVEESDIDQFHYMRAVIKEALRLHPPVPLLVPRESIEACVIDGYEIPAKTRVLVNTYAIGRDPQTWENPLEFNPERFGNIDIDIKGQQDFKLLPFGGGRRGCPGYSFGLATIETTLSKLLYHFDWELPPGVGADDVDMSEIFGLATRKREPLILLARNNKGYEFKEDQQSDA